MYRLMGFLAIKVLYLSYSLLLLIYTLTHICLTVYFPSPSTFLLLSTSPLILHQISLNTSMFPHIYSSPSLYSESKFSFLSPFFSSSHSPFHFSSTFLPSFSCHFSQFLSYLPFLCLSVMPSLVSRSNYLLRLPVLFFSHHLITSFSLSLFPAFSLVIPLAVLLSPFSHFFFTIFPCPLFFRSASPHSLTRISLPLNFSLSFAHADASLLQSEVPIRKYKNSTHTQKLNYK